MVGEIMPRPSYEIVTRHVMFPAHDIYLILRWTLITIKLEWDRLDAERSAFGIIGHYKIQ